MSLGKNVNLQIAESVRFCFGNWPNGVELWIYQRSKTLFDKLSFIHFPRYSFTIMIKIWFTCVAVRFLHDLTLDALYNHSTVHTTWYNLWHFSLVMLRHDEMFSQFEQKTLNFRHLLVLVPEITTSRGITVWILLVFPPLAPLYGANLWNF